MKKQMKENLVTSPNVWVLTRMGCEMDGKIGFHTSGYLCVLNDLEIIKYPNYLKN